MHSPLSSYLSDLAMVKGFGLDNITIASDNAKSESAERALLSCQLTEIIDEAQRLADPYELQVIPPRRASSEPLPLKGSESPKSVSRWETTATTAKLQRKSASAIQLLSKPKLTKRKSCDQCLSLPTRKESMESLGGPIEKKSYTPKANATFDKLTMHRLPQHLRQSGRKFLTNSIAVAILVEHQMESF